MPSNENMTLRKSRYARVLIGHNKPKSFLMDAQAELFMILMPFSSYFSGYVVASMQLFISVNLTVQQFFFWFTFISQKFSALFKIFIWIYTLTINVSKL